MPFLILIYRSLRVDNDKLETFIILWFFYTNIALRAILINPFLDTRFIV